MKKCISCLILLLFLTACAPNNREEPSFVLYFPNEQTASFAEMPFSADGLSLKTLVEEYCKAQPPRYAEPAIPEQWQLQEATCEGGIATVIFQGNAVSSLRTNTAAACLLQTLVQLSDVETLRLQAPGHEPIVLTGDDLLLNDSGMLPQKESIVLYLPDDSGRFLLRQTQTVEAVEAADKPGYILKQLLESASSCIPTGTKLLNISIEHEICTVDLSSEFLHNMNPSYHCERLAVYAIVNSLSELSEIKTVDIWIEGAPLEELKFMQLSNGLSRDENLISPTSEAYLDVTLYASCDGKSLVKVPQTAEISDTKTTEETVLDALLSFTSLDGAESPIPEGTKHLSVLREGNNCIVDLTEEFLQGCRDSQQEMLAVQSVVATMCNIPGISSVEILIEGLEPDYSVAWLKNFTKPQEEWFCER